MNISSVSNSFSINKNIQKSKTQKQTGVSFKGVYIDKLVSLNTTIDGSFLPRFLKKDALLLNEIAQRYPNQDCFIRKGYGGRPRLEYREKPPEVMLFDADFAEKYSFKVNALDDEYPCEPLIIYPDSDLNFIIGVPSYISTNPSLPYTVQVGFELHKKLLEKKMQIMDVVGKTDSVDFGGESVIKKAHDAIKEQEIALTRYLVESAYAALMDRASAKQIYDSIFPKIQSVLDEKRRIDLTTSVAKQTEIKQETVPHEEVDICEFVMKAYPSVKENVERIDAITNYMRENGITLEDSEDLE